MRIYIGSWALLDEKEPSRIEWVEGATEKEIEDEVNRQSTILLSSSEDKPSDMCSYTPEKLVGVYTPEVFCATFNGDLHQAINTDDYFIRMFNDPRPGKIHIATLVERCNYQVNVRATMHAATGPKLAADVIKFLDTEFDPNDEWSSNVKYNAKKILKECTKGNSGEDPLTIEFEGEDDHELFLSVHVIDNVPEKLRETFKSIHNNIRIPWDSFGEEQPVFGDLMDFLRDNFGAPKDLALGYMLLGERASRPEIRWDGLPSFEGFNELLKTVNSILEKNGKRCWLSHAGFSTSDGRPEFELTCTDEEGEITGIHTLNAFECLRYAESILEEEKGILPF